VDRTRRVVTADSITSHLVLLAITATAEFAAHAWSLDDTDVVFWATGKGLRVLPGHEELISLRIQAHARAGDLAGERQEWESYERVLVSDGKSAPNSSPCVANSSTRRVLDRARFLMSMGRRSSQPTVSTTARRPQ